MPLLRVLGSCNIATTSFCTEPLTVSSGFGPGRDWLQSPPLGRNDAISRGVDIRETKGRTRDLGIRTPKSNNASGL